MDFPFNNNAFFLLINSLININEFQLSDYFDPATERLILALKSTDSNGIFRMNRNVLINTRVRSIIIIYIYIIV
jgi:hypothetical protein